MALRRSSSYRGRRLRLDEALLERFAMSRLGYQYLLRVAPRIDRVVIPRTKGRLGSMGYEKVGLLTTVGAKSGQPRTNPVALIDVGGAFLATGSNYGRPPHPSWSTNLAANPDCELEFRGPPAPYRAELLEGDERAEAWDTIVDYYAGFGRYAETAAPRQIRVFRLRPR